VIGILGNIIWLFILILFLLIAFAATKYKYDIKEKMGVCEKRKGMRSVENVLANGFVPFVLSFLTVPSQHYPTFPKEVGDIMFISAISAATADTFASEIGVLSPNAYMITNLKKVKPGTNGAVSLLGNSVAFSSSFFISSVGWLSFSIFSVPLPRNDYLILLPIFAGFIGCQIDSILGATLERKILNKDRVNLISITIAVLMVWVLTYKIGW
ncbi:MAG: DUF92 domain-containing protein, partial [Candidatus Thermoplasmatota archaeon]